MKGVMLLLLVVLAQGVFAQTFEVAKDAYVNATLDLAQMEAEGLPTASIEDRLIVMNESLVGRDAEKLYQTAVLLNKSADGKVKAQEYFRMLSDAKRAGLKPGQNFKLVVSEGRAIRQLKEGAFEARDLVWAVEGEVNASGSASDVGVQDSLDKLKEAYRSEHYADVEGLAGETRALLENVEVERARERAFLGIARRNLSTYVLEHAFAFMLGIIIVALLGSWAFLEWRFVNAKRAQQWTKKALDGAQEALLSAQKKYYAGELARATYQGRVVQFHEKERDLKAKLAVWNGNVERFRKWSLVSRFR